MDYATLISEIYIQTGRPDLVNETAAALRSATLAAHSLNDLDLDESLVVMSCTGSDGLYNVRLSDVSNNNIYHLITAGETTDYGIVVVAEPEPDTTAPVIRKILNIWACDGLGKFLYELPRVPPAEVFGRGGFLQYGYRQAGANLSIRVGDELEFIAISYLGMPSTAEATYSSWIAEAAPYYLVHMAAAALLGPVIGKVEEANAQRSIAQGHLPAIYEHIRG